MGRNQKVVTAKQVAEFAGVSQATVSMILNNYSNASFTDETRKKCWMPATCLATAVQYKTE